MNVLSSHLFWWSGWAERNDWFWSMFSPSTLEPFFLKSHSPSVWHRLKPVSDVIRSNPESRDMHNSKMQTAFFFFFFAITFIWFWSCSVTGLKHPLCWYALLIIPVWATTGAWRQFSCELQHSTVDSRRTDSIPINSLLSLPASHLPLFSPPCELPAAWTDPTSKISDYRINFPVNTQYIANKIKACPWLTKLLSAQFCWHITFSLLHSLAVVRKDLFLFQNI